jgi:hypothetical protein
MGGVKAKIHSLGSLEAAREKSSYNKQDNGACHLCHNKNIPKAMPTAGYTPSAFMERVAGADAGSAKGRHDPHHEAC